MFKRVLAADERKRFLPLSKKAVAEFTMGDWQTLGAYTSTLDMVQNHPRLLRSLDFHDDDYEGCAHTMLNAIVERDPDANATEAPNYQEYSTWGHYSPPSKQIA